MFVVTWKYLYTRYAAKRDIFSCFSDGQMLSDIWLLRGNGNDADQSEDGRDCGRQYFNLILLHGIFMFIGWSVLLIMGIFAARYFRFLQPLWFKLHMVFQVY